MTHRGVRAFGVAAILACALALVSGGGAEARWLKAETDKFVVYSAGGERGLRDFVRKLDTYDSVLRHFHPTVADRKPHTRLQVVLVGRIEDLRRVQPRLPREVVGFYTAMNEGVFAFALRDVPGAADDVLFHEYAHHFMRENFPAAYPTWFVEGWAEYFMTTEITPNKITVGGFNPGRVHSLLARTWLPMEEVITRTTAETLRNRRGTFYAQSWILMHYMRSDPERAKQLNAATLAIANGEEPVKAFQDATGMTMPDLTRALRAYTRLPTLILEPTWTARPQAIVTPLPTSADDLLLDNLRLILWPTGTSDPETLARIRRHAAEHAGDRFAEGVLARAEFVMGDVAAGEAIMTRRLAAQPDDVEDLLLAGTGQILAGLRDAAQRDSRYRAARATLGKAYRLDSGDFRILYAYGLSRSIEPNFPTENDLKVLLEARGLAPSVEENSMRAGLALLKHGRKAEAAKMLALVLNNPHGGSAGAEARRLVTEAFGGLPPADAEDGAEAVDAPAPAVR